MMTGHWTVASFFEKFSSPCWQHPPLLLLAAPGIFLSVSYTKLLVFSFIRPSPVKSLLSAKVFPLLVFKGGQDFSLEAHTFPAVRLVCRQNGRAESIEHLSLSLCAVSSAHTSVLRMLVRRVYTTTRPSCCVRPKNDSEKRKRRNSTDRSRRESGAI